MTWTEDEELEARLLNDLREASKVGVLTPFFGDEACAVAAKLQEYFASGRLDRDNHHTGAFINETT